MTDYFVDPVNGSDAADGTSFANRKKTLSSAAALCSAGDRIKIMASKGFTATSDITSCVWTNKSGVITLGTGSRTQLITDCGSAWTQSTNVTATTSSTRKEGTLAASIAIASAFTTGKAAYFATSALNLSGFTGISFWIQPSTQVTSGVLRIDLCSDSAGATPVNSFTINYTLRASQWHPLTLYSGGALGSNINSIALYCISDPGTNTVILDNILAVNENDLCLNSLVCKSSEDGVFTGSSQSHAMLYPIRSINGTTLIVDAPYANANGTLRGYYGTTETADLRIFEPTRVADTATAASTQIQSYSGVSGNSSNLVTVSGGWDTTSMSAQDSITILDGLCRLGSAWSTSSNSKQWIRFEKLGAIRTDTAGSAAGSIGTNCTWSFIYTGATAVGLRADLNSTTNITWDNILAIGCTTAPWGAVLNRDTFLTSMQAVSCGSSVTYSTSSSTSGRNVNVDGLIVANCSGTLTLTGFSGCRNITSVDNGGAGITLIGANAPIYNVTVANNNSGITQSTGSSLIYGLTSSGNGGIGIQCLSGANDLIVYDADISDSTKVTYSSGFPPCSVRLHRSTTQFQNTIYAPYGSTSMQSSVANTGVTYAWDYAVTNNAAVDSGHAHGAQFPIIPRIPCKGGMTNTLTFYTRNTNANLKMQGTIYGGRYPGVGSAGTDITVDCTPSSTNTWQQFSIDITPSEDCVVDFYMLCWATNGTTTYHGYVSGPTTLVAT